MKQSKLLIAGALLCGLAATAWADNNITFHNGYWYNNATGQKTDANGNVLQNEANPPVIQVGTWIPLINDTTGFTIADSSIVQTNYAGYILHGLWIRCVPVGAGAPPSTKLAIQIRTHLGGVDDTLSTAPVALGGHFTITSNATIAADSSAYTFTTLPTRTAAADDEIVVSIIRESSGATAWASPVNRYIPIETPTGGQLRLPNFSVRERVIGSTSGTPNSSLATAQIVQVYGYVTVLK